MVVQVVGERMAQCCKCELGTMKSCSHRASRSHKYSVVEGMQVLESGQGFEKDGC